MEKLCIIATILAQMFQRKSTNSVHSTGPLLSCLHLHSHQTSSLTKCLLPNYSFPNCKLIVNLLVAVTVVLGWFNNDEG